MRQIIAILTLLGMGVLMTNPVSAASSKSQYWLFSPTPRDQMRELSADRPDKTESPHSVDAGHFQIEASAFSYTYDKRNPNYSGDSVHGFSVMPMLLKLGLTNFMDFHVGIEPYIHNINYNFSTGTSQSEDGFGDVVLRTKIALVGNDTGRFALAAMPFVSIPTKKGDNFGSDHVEGGLVFPWALDLEKGWGLSGQAQFNYNYGANNTKYYVNYLNTFELTYEISERFGAYVELYALISPEVGVPWVGTVDTGMTFSVNDNLQLDAGINMGVTRSADDYNPFIGFTWRH